MTNVFALVLTSKGKSSEMFFLATFNSYRWNFYTWRTILLMWQRESLAKYSPHSELPKTCPRRSCTGWSRFVLKIISLLLHHDYKHNLCQHYNLSIAPPRLLTITQKIACSLDLCIMQSPIKLASSEDAWKKLFNKKNCNLGGLFDNNIWNLEEIFF